MHSTHNKGESAGAKTLIRILKNKIYKYMTSLSKNVCIDKLYNIVIKCNNTYQSTIKLKPFDIKSSLYIDFNKENNMEDPKFEDGDRVKISKYKNIFAKRLTENWSEEVFLIKKVKNIVPCTSCW